MKFTHLIEINNLANPLIAPLTRSQLWHGLVLRAERPTLFLIGLDSCEITARSVEGLSRRLHFGKLEVIVGHGAAFQLLDGLLQTVPGFCGSLFFEARKPRRSGT